MPFVDPLYDTFDALGKRLARVAGQYDILTAQLETVNAKRDALKARGDMLSQCLGVLHGMETTWRDRFQQGLAAVVSEGLTSVFADQIEVKLETSQYRDATAIDLRVMQGGIETDVEEAKGGSLVQVLSFLLRVLLVVSVQPKLRHVLLLDEPFGMVSKEFRPAVAELLMELSNRLDLQMVIITHEEDYLACADRAYVVHLVDGATPPTARMATLETSEERQ